MSKSITTFLIVALFGNSFAVSAQSNAAAEIKFKRQIVAAGINQNVKLQLTSNETLEGRIAEIGNDSFTLQFVDAAGQVTKRTLTYSELSKVSKTGGRKAVGAVKRGFLYGAGFYVGMLAVGALVIGIASAAAR